MSSGGLTHAGLKNCVNNAGSFKLSHKKYQVSSLTSVARIPLISLSLSFAYSSTKFDVNSCSKWPRFITLSTGFCVGDLMISTRKLPSTIILSFFPPFFQLFFCQFPTRANWRKLLESPFFLSPKRAVFSSCDIGTIVMLIYIAFSPHLHH